jgi:hypothetical protein
MLLSNLIEVEVEVENNHGRDCGMCHVTQYNNIAITNLSL